MITVLVLVIATRQPMFGFSPTAYGWLLALGLIPQLIGHSTLNWALWLLSATYVSIVTLAEPIGSAILAFLVLDETITRVIIIGGALVLAGIYVASSTTTVVSQSRPPERSLYIDMASKMGSNRYPVLLAERNMGLIRPSTVVVLGGTRCNQATR